MKIDYTLKSRVTRLSKFPKIQYKQVITSRVLTDDGKRIPLNSVFIVPTRDDLIELFRSETQ